MSLFDGNRNVTEDRLYNGLLNLLDALVKGSNGLKEDTLESEFSDILLMAAVIAVVAAIITAIVKFIF